MLTYQILIEYDGTNFVGWQRQKNGISIQETIEKVLLKILKEKIFIYGSGRTDAGVHAIEQSAHFKINNQINNINKFLNSLNFFLRKKNISILDVKKKKKSFHARFSAKKRLYEYLIINRNASLSLDVNRAWHVKNNLDIKLMQRGAKLLKGCRDFSTFRASTCVAKTPHRTIDLSKVIKKNNKIIITFKSKSFLQQQVRSMVGCLKYLGEKKWSLKKFREVIYSKKRVNCAPPAPPSGLYLKKIIY